MNHFEIFQATCRDVVEMLDGKLTATALVRYIELQFDLAGIPLDQIREQVDRDAAKIVSHFAEVKDIH